jgi:DNA-binding IclR family transcriptional regulator
VGRLLRILEWFSPERIELTIAEISRRAELPSSTVYRLLGELVGRGVIERSTDGRYSVGLRLWEMGKLAPRAEWLTDVATPHLHDLYEATRRPPATPRRPCGRVEVPSRRPEYRSAEPPEAARSAARARAR